MNIFYHESVEQDILDTTEWYGNIDEKLKSRFKNELK